MSWELAERDYLGSDRGTPRTRPAVRGCGVTVARAQRGYCGASPVSIVKLTGTSCDVPLIAEVACDSPLSIGTYISLPPLLRLQLSSKYIKQPWIRLQVA